MMTSKRLHNDTSSNAMKMLFFKRTYYCTVTLSLLRSNCKLLCVTHYAISTNTIRLTRGIILILLCRYVYCYLLYLVLTFAYCIFLSFVIFYFYQLLFVIYNEVCGRRLTFTYSIILTLIDMHQSRKYLTCTDPSSNSYNNTRRHIINSCNILLINIYLLYYLLLYG